MEEKKDTYKTVLESVSEIIFKDKGSKFIGYLFPIETEDEIKYCLEELKKKHHTARHFCYAWQLGTSELYYRANDGGEPSNSAGMPIYGQIQSFELTNVLIVVVRYFGGVKLGVGGLINAYKTTAKLTLEETKIVEKIIEETLTIEFEYPLLNKVMRVIKEQDLKIKSQHMELKCTFQILVRQRDVEKVHSIFLSIYGVTIKDND